MTASSRPSKALSCEVIRHRSRSRLRVPGGILGGPTLFVRSRRTDNFKGCNHVDNVTSIVVWLKGAGAGVQASGHGRTSIIRYGRRIAGCRRGFAELPIRLLILPPGCRALRLLDLGMTMSEGRRLGEQDSPDPEALLDNIIRLLQSCTATAPLAEPYREKREDCRRDRLRIGVIGITSSGKSTFLNALIGRPLLPEQSKATTNLLVSCRRGPLCIEVSFEDGRTPKRLAGNGVTPRRLRRLCAEDQNPQNRKGVSEIILWSPNMRLDSRFELVDTPGLDAFGLDHHEELTLRRFLPEADIVIYTTAIRNPLKKADLRVLNQIIQHDQRVVFVQTAADLEVDSTERGRVVQSRQEKLDKHLRRLRTDVRKHAPQLKAWHYAQVSSKWAQDIHRYPSSGFDPLLQSIDGLGKELIPIISKRVLRETEGLLRGTLENITQRIAEIQGEEVEAQEKDRERKDGLKALQACLSRLKEIRAIQIRNWDGAVSPENLARKIRNHLPVGVPEDQFRDQWDQCVVDLKAMMRPFLRSLDEAEKDCERALAKVDIQPARTVDSSCSIPQGGLNLSWKWISETVYKRKWYTLWLYEHEEQSRRKVVDKEKSRKDLCRYAKSIGKELSNHLAWWQDKRFRERYAAPVEKRLQHLEDMRKVIAATPAQDKQDLLRIREGLNAIMEQMEAQRSGVQSGESSTSQSGPEDGASEASRSPAFLVRLRSCYKELAFHRQLLTLLHKLNGSNGRPVVLCLGVKKDDGRNLVGLLRHKVKSVEDAEFSSDVSLFCAPDWETRGSFTSGTGCSLFAENLTIWKHMVCVVPDVASRNIKESDWDELFACADAVAVFVNLSQIDSALNDLRSSPWCEVARRSRVEIFYICLEMALFQTKPHELVSSVIPKLWTQGPFGERQVFLSEAYDYRYTTFAEIGLSVREAMNRRHRAERRVMVRKAVQQWKALRIPMDPPFTEEYLRTAFEKMDDDMRCRTDGRQSSPPGRSTAGFSDGGNQEESSI